MGCWMVQSRSVVIGTTRLGELVEKRKGVEIMISRVGLTNGYGAVRIARGWELATLHNVVMYGVVTVGERRGGGHRGEKGVMWGQGCC